MKIWKKEITLEELNASSKNTLVEYIGIEFTAFDDNNLYAAMPVDERTYQPMGILHGGANVVLAETVGSLAANLTVEEGFRCVGLDISANHLKSVSKGRVHAKASPIHIGRRTQVWNIEIRDDRDRLTCVSRLTMAVLEPK